MQKTLISKEAMRSYTLDTLVMCIALFAVGIYINGMLAFYQVLVCVVSAVLSEYLGFHLLLKKKTLSDLNAVMTGFVIALLLPASAPLWVGASASAFAILVAKLPFGDSRNAPFFPAAAGFCFAAMFFPNEVFTYPAVSEAANTLFMNREGFLNGTTLIDMLKNGDSLTLNVFGISKLLSGNIPGSVGTTSLVALLGAVGYLLVRKPKRLIPTAGFLLSAGLMALMFPRINAGRLTSLIMELCAGSLLFVAVLILNNPVTAPQKPREAFVYGLIGGIIAMLLRYFSKTYDTAVFTLLIMNALWPVFSSSTPATKNAARKEVQVNG